MKWRALWPAGAAILMGSCGGGGGSGGGGQPPPVPGPPACSAGISMPVAFPDLVFDAPVAMKQAPGDPTRWYVVEQGGLVRSFANQPDADETGTFLDLTGRVHVNGEAGLLGLAFHPGFAVNGRAYVNFSELVNGTVRSVTAEFTSADGGLTLDPASERVLFRVSKHATNHNGGNVEFGPDGLLYVGLGDGGGSGDPRENAQDPQVLLGKMLRIDVDARPGGAPYAIPAGNPFFGNALCDADGRGNAPCPEIFALGFRNPWRWSFDRQTGDLWVGDVGQGRFEEIDVVEAGGNYGWDVREGAHCFEPMDGCDPTGFTDPVAEYGRDLGFSITGGYVYRGLQQTEVAGRYVFGDFGGMVATLAPDGASGFTIEPLVEQDCAPDGAPAALSIASFAEDLDGELFALDYGRGRVHSLLFTD